MELIAIPVIAAFASLVTFFSGFGLGTILTPVFVIFFPIELAVSMTAIVHLLNNLFKVGLVGKHTVKSILIRFGGPAVLFAMIGAWVLNSLAQTPPVTSYSLWGRVFEIHVVKCVVALVMIFFTLFEILPSLKNIKVHQKYLSLGGALSGFFGGLSGHQGALRSAFLARTELSKEEFVATGVAIACLIDCGRLAIYARSFSTKTLMPHLSLLILTTAFAFMGAYLGHRFLKKLTMNSVQKIVAVMLGALAVALGLGIL